MGHNANDVSESCEHQIDHYESKAHEDRRSLVDLAKQGKDKCEPHNAEKEVRDVGTRKTDGRESCGDAEQRSDQKNDAFKYY